MSLNTELTHHSFSILNLLSSLVCYRVRRYISSYLTRRGRGYYPGFFQFLSDVSVPLADDIISNEKTCTVWSDLFTQIFNKNANCCSVKIFNVHFLHRVTIKQLFCIVKFDNSSWIVISLAIIFELPVSARWRQLSIMPSMFRAKYIG